MSNTVEWKVEALTDGRNWSDISSYVQSLNINIGKPDDVDEFDTGSASVTLDNRDGRFDPEYDSPFYTGRGRINYVTNPQPTNGTPLFWASFDGFSYGNATYSTAYSGSIVSGTSDARFINNAYLEYDNINYPYNFVEVADFNDGIYINNEWTISADIAYDFTKNFPTLELPGVGVGFDILDENFEIIQSYSKMFTASDNLNYTTNTMQKYSATFNLSYFFNKPPKYIRAMILKHTYNTEIYFKNVMLERTGQLNSYFDGSSDVQTYFGTSWLGVTGQSPSFYWTDKPFDIGTEIKISARRGNELYVPKFYGYVSSLDFNDSVDGYSLVTLSLTDETSAYTTKPIVFSGFREWALNQNPIAPLQPFSFAKFTSLRYFTMSELKRLNNTYYFESEPGPLQTNRRTADFENYESTMKMPVFNAKSFVDNQEPIAQGLSRSTLVVHSGLTDLISPKPDVLKIEPAPTYFLEDWRFVISGNTQGFWFSSWFLPVSIPVGGLTLWEMATEKVTDVFTNLETDFTNSFEVIVNPDGSISFRSTTIGGVATTVSTSAGYVDVAAPLNIVIRVPSYQVDGLGSAPAPGTPFPIYAYINGQFVLDLTGLVNTASAATSLPSFFRIAGTAGGSFYMSDFFVIPDNTYFFISTPIIDTEMQNPDFIEGYNYAINIDYENLNDKTDFIQARSDLELQVPQRRFNDAEVDSENLFQTQFYEQGLLDGLKSLSNASYGYLSVDYENNKPKFLTRFYMQEQTQLTSYTFSDKNVGATELKFKDITYERNNELVSNIIQVQTPQKFDNITKLPLAQRTSYLGTNPDSIRKLGNRFISYQTVDVKEDVSQGLVEWKKTELGSVNNKVRAIDFQDGEANETQAIVNMKLGQKVILKRTIPRLSNSPQTVTSDFRVTRISISATPDRTTSQIGLMALENETMAILGTATTDESRLGF
jgi:hypothetical protein